MTYTRTLLPLFCLVTIPSALAAQRVPGSGYAMTVTTDSGGRKTTVSIQTEAMGSKYRNTIKSDIVAATPLDMFTIFDSTAGTMTNVIPSRNMATINSLSILKMAGQQTRYTTELGGNPKVEMVDLGAGERILGFATKRYRLTLDFTLKITIGGESCIRSAHEVSEVWVTQDVKLPDPSATLRRVVGLTTPAGGLESKIDSIRKRTTKGAMLRRVSTSSTLRPAGDSLHVTSKMEITAINSDSVDAQDFEVPAGLNVMDMREIMASADPAVMQQAMLSAQSSTSDKLKQSLCGGSGN